MNNASKNLIDEDVPRNAIEIAKRILALYGVLEVAHGTPKLKIINWLKTQNLYDELCPWEKKFIETDERSQRDKNQAMWRVEALVVLLWAIKKIDHLEEPTSQCNPSVVIDALPTLDSSTSEFIASAILRSAEEIERENERIYDIHWKVRNVQIKGTPIKYEGGVVQERHYAMNWITGYCGQEWDDITTDT